MIKLKTEEEIKRMVEGGKKLRAVVKKLLPVIKPGITTHELDIQAEKLIRLEGAESSFKRVKGYHWTTCLPINQQVVHTPPSDRVMKNGDLLTLDIGVYYKGLNTDYATSQIIGDEKNPEIENFLRVGSETLAEVINKADKFRYLGEISKLIEERIYGNGYFILKALTGHGIGVDLHEDPFIPGFLDRPVEKTYEIKAGLVVAIEVIYSVSAEEIKNEKSHDWSVVTSDGSLSACFEHTIAFTKNGVIRLT